MQNYVCKGYAGISILNYWCRSVAHETLLFQTGQALWGGVSCSQITVKSNEIFRASVFATDHYHLDMFQAHNQGVV